MWKTDKIDITPMLGHKAKALNTLYKLYDVESEQRYLGVISEETLFKLIFDDIDAIVGEIIPVEMRYIFYGEGRSQIKGIYIFTLPKKWKIIKKEDQIMRRFGLQYSLLILKLH